MGEKFNSLFTSLLNDDAERRGLTGHRRVARHVAEFALGSGGRSQDELLQRHGARRKPHKEPGATEL